MKDTIVQVTEIKSNQHERATLLTDNFSITGYCKLTNNDAKM